MTTAKLTGGFYVASILAILVAFALSWRASMETRPRLEVTWTLRSGSTEPTVPGVSGGNAVAPVAPAPHVIAPPPPEKTEVARVEERLKDNLTQELYDDFGLFLYVSKAATGPWAQRMYVFRKEANGDFALLYRWPVSTGRERVEITTDGARVSTRTPTGYYELDPRRFYRRYESSEWHQPMPYAMFFNWTRRGRLAGLAIHGATSKDVAELGKRASAGCIHLSPQAARTLYALIRAKYRGKVPRFAIDRAGTMSNEGIVLHDMHGRPKTAPGYRVLVFIENYGGRNLIAAMY